MNISIDEILNNLSVNNSMDTQAEGCKCARQIQHLSVLIMPTEGKHLWHNCAKVLATKTDNELSPYLFCLFEWLQDMNWPGAEVIYQRLLGFKSSMLLETYHLCLSLAIERSDSMWQQALQSFYHDYTVLT